MTPHDQGFNRPGPSTQSSLIPPSIPHPQNANSPIQDVLEQILANQKRMSDRQDTLIEKERQRTAREALNVPQMKHYIYLIIIEMFFLVNRNGGRKYLTPV